MVKSFEQDLTSNSAMVPVVFADAESEEIIATNVSKGLISKRIKQMKYENEPINIDLGHTKKSYIFKNL